MYDNTMRSASDRLNLCLLTAILLTALPSAAHAQNASSSFATCGVRHNRADFDGDCDSKADIAVQRLGDGYWHIVRSSTGNYYTVMFIYPEFPVPGAYLTPLS